MKAISQLLLNEQIQLNRKPCVKIQIQEYGFPAESNKIIFNQYDWSQVTLGSEASKVAGTASAPNGDSCVVTGSVSATSATYSTDIRYNFNLSATITRSGVPSTATATIACDIYKFNLGYFTSWLDYSYQHPEGQWMSGYVYTPVVFESIDVAYDDDWFVTYTGSQTKPGSSGGSGQPVSKGSIVYGLYGIVLGNGTNASKNSWINNGEINLTETKANINSLSQMSHFSPSILTGEASAYEQTMSPVLLSQPELLRMATIHPKAYLHKITGYPLLLSLWSEGKAFICELKRGTTILTATFDKAYTFYNDEPVLLSSDATYIYAFNTTKTFRSPLPGFWTVPTAGSGVGSYMELGE
jgi:hypothetical protein